MPTLLFKTHGTDNYIPETRLKKPGFSVPQITEKCSIIFRLNVLENTADIIHIED